MPSSGHKKMLCLVMIVVNVTLHLSLVYGQSQRSVQRARINTNVGKERIRVDPNREQEEIDLPDKKIRILNDFKMSLSVYRIAAKPPTACFLRPLNQTGMMPPKALARYIKAGGNLQPDAKSKTITADLVVAKTQVKDISFLSDRARAMCQGLPTHWLLPLEKADRRQKRILFRLFSFAITFITEIIINIFG